MYIQPHNLKWKIKFDEMLNPGRMRSLRVLLVMVVLVVLVVPSLGSPCLHQHCLEDCVKERALEEPCTQYCDMCRYSKGSGRLRNV